MQVPRRRSRTDNNSRCRPQGRANHALGGTKRDIPEEVGIKHKRRSTKTAEVLASLMLRRRSGIAFGDCYVQVRPPAPDFAASSLRPFPQDSIRNHEALRGADAVCQIRRQLLKMSDVESVDSIATCFLCAAQVESVADSPPYPSTVRTFLYRLPIHLRRQSHDLKIREYVHRE
jgi:hypothetical protein